jgi:hypothetical protein
LAWSSGNARAAPVERTVLNSFGQVSDCDGVLATQIGDGARHAQHAMIRPRGKTETLHGRAQQSLAGRVDATVLA